MPRTCSNPIYNEAARRGISSSVGRDGKAVLISRSGCQAANADRRYGS